jgi:hypothetical protein
MPPRGPQPWRRDPHQTASGKPGAVHSASGSGSRGRSAGRRLSPGCARPATAACPRSSGNSPWPWPPTTWSGSRSCSIPRRNARRLPEDARPAEKHAPAAPKINRANMPGSAPGMNHEQSGGLSSSPLKRAELPRPQRLMEKKFICNRRRYLAASKKGREPAASTEKFSGGSANDASSRYFPLNA